MRRRFSVLCVESQVCGAARVAGMPRVRSVSLATLERWQQMRSFDDMGSDAARAADRGRATGVALIRGGLSLSPRMPRKRAMTIDVYGELGRAASARCGAL
jgi:hypothetical protein